MQAYKTFILIISLLLGAVMTTHADTRAKFEPPEGKILLIVGQDDKTLDTFASEVGQKPGGIMMYTSIQTMEGLDSVSKDYGSGTYFTDEMLKKYPDAVLQIGLYMVDALEDTYSGKYDSNIEKLGHWSKQAQTPVFLRIGYECDGAHNHYDPAQYKKAFTYLVFQVLSP